MVLHLEFVGLLLLKVTQTVLFTKPNISILILGTGTDLDNGAATAKIELFFTIVDGFKPLTIAIKSIILGDAAVLDPLLGNVFSKKHYSFQFQSRTNR